MKRQRAPEARLSAANAKARFAAAPATAHTAKMRLAGKRSAIPERANVSVPRMKPSWTAIVRRPMPALSMPQRRARSSKAALALNQSEVPKSCATTMIASLPSRACTSGSPFVNASAMVV
jgi:hypothetical protein